MAGRGRPPRDGERATVRKEIILTLAEWRRVRAFMKANRYATFADALRMTLLAEAEEHVESNCLR